MIINAFKTVRNLAATAGGLFLMLGLVAGRPAMATPIYYLSTGQSGAQTQIDVNHTTSWSFTATSDWSLGGGNFTMKDGSGTTADVMLAVYQGADSLGTLLAFLTLTDAQFCGLHPGTHCSSFEDTPFHFVTPFAINDGTPYFIALTSSAADVQAQAYFIKGVQGSSFLDAQSNALPSQTLTSQAAAAVPEPATLAILGVGFLGVALARGRKRGVAA